MGENCNDCTVWEEEMYWTHFQTIHFSQFLHPGFDQRLAIPEKFARNCKKKLPETVTLKSPSGNTYNIGLAGENNMLVFRHGWEEFVKDHSLEENDLLVFKFNGVSHFDVLIFDGESLCEKATSYFVRKCGHEERASGHHGKRKQADYSAATSSSCGLDGTPKKHINCDVETTPVQQPEMSVTVNEKLSEGKYPVSTFWTMQTVRSNVQNLGTDLDIKPDIRTMSVGTKKRSGSSKYLSERRAITESDKRNALSLAQAATSQDGFMVVMKRSHVIAKYYLTIPNKWILRYLSTETQEVVLRIGQRTWHTRFSYTRPRNYGGLSGGWRKFVVDNCLNEFDVCVFEPGNPGTKPLLLDVSIFRAVEVEPVTMVQPVTIY